MTGKPIDTIKNEEVVLAEYKTVITRKKFVGATDRTALGVKVLEIKNGNGGKEKEWKEWEKEVCA